MKRIRIHTAKPYEVLLGHGLLPEAGRWLSAVCRSKRVVIVTDKTVEPLYGKTVTKALEQENFTCLKYVLPDGENSKNAENLLQLLNFLAENQIRRNDTLIALGGGVIGDLVGFAAAIYLRGIAVVQIPTTLLSMVDSSVGGKTGIDLPAGKNLVGAFWQPELVLADLDTLATLPPEQLAAGMGEVIKCGVIGNNGILDCLETADMEARIADCIALKADVVARDERDENGEREMLNAGHTVAHAIEKLSDYSIPHGKAVAMGLVVEARMAVDLGLAEVAVYDRILKAVRAFDLCEKVPYLPEKMAQAMQRDKKNRDEKIAFILPEKIGECVRQTLTVQQVIDLLSKQ